MILESSNNGVEGFLTLDRRVSGAPESLALLAPGRTPLTFADLLTQVHDLGNALSNAGVGAGEVTALVLPNGPELITAVLAITNMGACAPLDPTLTAGEYQVFLNRLGARTLITQAGVPSPAVAAARSLRMRVIQIRILPENPAGIFELADPGETAAGPGRKTGAALLLFTSATTDSPKLVPLTWDNLRWMALHDSRALELNASDRLLSLMPLFHLHGLAAVLTQLSSGGGVISTAGFEPDSFAAWLAALRPTWLTSSPPINRAILTLARGHPGIFRNTSLRFIRSGTAPSDPELLGLLEAAAGVPVLNGYGMTETGGVARNTPRFRKPGSVGRSSGLELAIMDPSGNSLPPDSHGEIVVRGRSVTTSYLDNPEANCAAFRNGWFHTGDIGRLDSEGFLFITNRLKETINRGGEKIAPQDVEAVLLAHPAVAEAAVVAIPHATLGEDVAAAVVLRQEAIASESDLRRFAASRLAHFKVPRRIVVVDSIPRTATGKPKRGSLAERLQRSIPPQSIPPDRQSDARALEPIETALLGIWRRILNVEQIDVTGDFFAYGGDSLSAAAMLAEVQRTLHASPELLERVEFFDNPTIEMLAGLVKECGPGPVDPDAPNSDAESPSSRVLALRSTGSHAPFFCFPAIYPDSYYFRHLARGLGEDQPFFVVRPVHPVKEKRLLSVHEIAQSSVAAIRRIRPHGPYLVGGHCYGGVVAFETARQLAAEGEAIIALVLFDVKTPGYPRVNGLWKRYVTRARDLALVSEHVRALGRLVTRRFAGRASRALAAVGSDLLARHDQRTLYGMVMGEYRPHDLPAPIIHFIAADQPVSTKVASDPRLDWQHFATAGLEERMVGGDHNTMFMEANANAIAEQLNALLAGGPSTLSVTVVKAPLP